MSRYATDLADAQSRFAQYKSVDPFPGVSPALLNSADIDDYVAATGMLFPFFPEGRLKPASYGISLKGKCIWWEGGERRACILSDDSRDGQPGYDVVSDLVIKPNSIFYVSLEPVLMLPDYIAARFNLVIDRVYQGFLAGIGPLVDPGFVGRLSFPLHNLTSASYTISAGKPIVWMEFTKISVPDAVAKSSSRIVREGKFEPFPLRKLSRSDLSDYLHNATGGQPIVSSIPGAVSDAHKVAQDAQRIAQGAQTAAKDADTRSARLSIVGVAALVVLIPTMIALYFSVFAIVQTTQGMTKDVVQKDTELGRAQADLTTKVDNLSKEVAALRKQIKPKH